jgi:hypothetical protein
MEPVIHCSKGKRRRARRKTYRVCVIPIHTGIGPVTMQIFNEQETDSDDGKAKPTQSVDTRGIVAQAQLSDHQSSS